MKRISVIIPTYNCSKYVGGAIQSILDQSYANIEIIVVDDGSTDDTKDSILPFMNRIVYVFQENRGLPGARNRGMQEASGEYLAFLDADDLWRNNKLEIQAKVLDSFPYVSIVFSDFSVFSESGYRKDCYFYKCFPIFQQYDYNISDIFCNKTKLYAPGLNKELTIYYGNICKYLFCGNFILPSSVLMRKSAVDKLSGFDEKYKIAEETEFFLRICTSFDAAYVDHPLVDYLVKRIGNLTGSSNIERLIKNAINIQESYIAKHPQLYQANRPHFDGAVAKSYIRLAYYYLTMINNRNARVEARNSMSWKYLQLRAYAYWLFSFCPTVLLTAARKLKGSIRQNSTD